MWPLHVCIIITFNAGRRKSPTWKERWMIMTCLELVVNISLICPFVSVVSAICRQGAMHTLLLLHRGPESPQVPQQHDLDACRAFRV